MVAQSYVHNAQMNRVDYARKHVIRPEKGMIERYVQKVDDMDFTSDLTIRKTTRIKGNVEFPI